MKKLRFWLLIAVYLLLAFADGALTYINTPDLSFEGNPLVTELGLGWGALAIANIAVFAMLFALAYYSYFKYETILTNETKYTAYWSQITFDRPDRFWHGFILFPKHWKPIIAAFGASFPYAMIVARLVLVLEWLSITFHWPGRPRYSYFVRTYCFGRLDCVLAIIVLFLCIFIWIYFQFKKQLKKNTAE